MIDFVIVLKSYKQTDMTSKCFHMLVVNVVPCHHLTGLLRPYLHPSEQQEGITLKIHTIIHHSSGDTWIHEELRVFQLIRGCLKPTVGVVGVWRGQKAPPA